MDNVLTIILTTTMKSFAFAFAMLPLCAFAGSAVATPTESAGMQVKGTFDVKINPRQADNPHAEVANLVRMSLDKRYHGALDATGQGEMLAVGDGTVSGAYVAIEKVDGTLDGRSGSFALVHSAVMRHGVPENWSVTVVPDSGTGELEGIEGTMTINIVDGAHHYELEYRLPDSITE